MEFRLFLVATPEELRAAVETARRTGPQDEVPLLLVASELLAGHRPPAG